MRFILLCLLTISCAPPVPRQEWTVTSDIRGAVPIRPPCAPPILVEINGACWVPLDVSPCPVQKGDGFMVRDGTCYGIAVKAAP